MKKNENNQNLENEEFCQNCGSYDIHSCVVEGVGKHLFEVKECKECGEIITE